MRNPLLAAGLLIASSTPALSGDFDGSKSLLCASTEMISCVPHEMCRRERPETLNAPEFLAVRFAEKTITNPRQGDITLSSDIHNLRDAESDLVVDGVDDRLAWSLAIAKDSGKMTLTATRVVQEEPVAIVIFGVCTPQ